MIFIRSLIFSLVMLVLTGFVAITGFLTAPLPLKMRNYFIRYYALSVLIAVKFICGIRYEVTGTENIDDETCILISNHQSTWETLVVQEIFPHLCFVVKKELLWVPLFGWALAMLAPIAIDRKSGRNAIQQIVEQGTSRLQSGIWVVIFPEGTRIAYDKKARHKKGGAILAKSSGFNIIPMAHNAGKYWPKKGFLKKPGTIKVVIGKKILTKSLSVDEIIKQTQNWIESTRKSLK
ncbi:MAG: lysophospholipid acyltransferase family protein [Thiohalomonadales bacterium]